MVCACRHATGASFVKPHKVDCGVSVLEAMHTQYTAQGEAPPQHFTVTDSRKVQVSVELVGAAQVQARFRCGGGVISARIYLF
jgi:hypothetical protein